MFARHVSRRFGSALFCSSLMFGMVALRPGVLGAQAATGAVLKGSAIDDETGEPVGAVIVRIPGLPVVNGDSLGHFEVPNLPLGEIEVTVQGLGYRALRVKIRVNSDTDVIQRRFAMEFDGQELPEIVVSARAQKLVPRYVDFERRRERGLGAYFRWDEIKDRGFNRVGDALRTVRGVRIKCDQRSFECYAYMSRSQNCAPVWYIDGVRVGSFHENTPIRDLYGIEIYRGPGETPAEFTGSDAACGAIIMWTKSRPFRP